MTVTDPDGTPPDHLSSDDLGAETGSGPAGEASRAASRQRQRRSRRLRVALEWTAVVLVAFLAALGIKAWLIQAFYIPSGSMIPTLNVGDRILVNKLSYHLHPVNRGDIIVFSTPPNDNSDPNIKDLVKRVVGLPGDTITSVGGHVEINGKPLNEPYLPAGTQTVGITPEKIPPDHYWVMGDNRQDSKDSRFFGPISKSLIVGRAMMRVWPITQISLL